MKNISCLCFFALLCCVGLSSCEKKSEIEISELVVREMPPGTSVASAYLKIKNQGHKTRILNYVHTERADRVEVHRHVYEDGKMKMREVRHLAINPGSVLIFKPGEHHLMLFDTATPFVAGENVEIIFEFEELPPISVLGTVKKL